MLSPYFTMKKRTSILLIFLIYSGSSKGSILLGCIALLHKACNQARRVWVGPVTLDTYDFSHYYTYSWSLLMNSEGITLEDRIRAWNDLVRSGHKNLTGHQFEEAADISLKACVESFLSEKEIAKVIEKLVELSTFVDFTPMANIKLRETLLKYVNAMGTEETQYLKQKVEGAMLGKWNLDKGFFAIVQTKFSGTPRDYQDDMESFLRGCWVLSYKEKSKAGMAAPITFQDPNRIVYNHTLKNQVVPQNTFPTLLAISIYDLKGAGEKWTLSKRHIPANQAHLLLNLEEVEPEREYSLFREESRIFIIDSKSDAKTKRNSTYEVHLFENRITLRSVEEDTRTSSTDILFKKENLEATDDPHREILRMISTAIALIQS